MTRHGLPPLYRQLVYPYSSCGIFDVEGHKYHTGTVHANRKYLPAGVKQKLPKGDLVAFRKNNIVCIGWHDKKHVILLSTQGSSKMITYTSKRNREHYTTELVRNYNLHMGGEDLSDMRTYMFLDERRREGQLDGTKKFFTLFGR